MKARVKETGEIIFVRTPYFEEYISSIYEPDYIKTDSEGNTIYYSDENWDRNVYSFDGDELEFID